MPAAQMKYRVKGTKLYMDAYSPPHETVGTGRRSVAMRAPSYGPNSAIQFSGTQLRDQARDADRKNLTAHTISDRLVSNMIGTGIRPQPASGKAEKLWNKWSVEASSDGLLDFYGLQAQIARAMVVSGECFVRIRVRRPEDGLTVPLQVQVLESDFVPANKNEALGGGSYIQQGIEFNAIGKRVAYWMHQKHPGDNSVVGLVNSLPVRVDASEVLHIFDAISARPGQIRGETWLTQGLGKLKDFDSYEDAELKRKELAALLMAFIRKNVPEGMSLEDLKKVWGDEAEMSDGVGEIALEAGTAQYLEMGESVEWSKPTDVGGQYEVFIKQQYRALSAAAGLLYEQVTGDFSNLNDRTWRAAFNEFKRRCEMWQHHLIVFQFCRPVWDRWAALARMGNNLSVKDTVQPPWVPQAWPYINPKQDIEASDMEMRAGLASRSQKASERGKNSADIDAEQAEDNKRADRLGLKYDSDARKSKSGATAKPKASDDVDASDQSEPDEKENESA